MDELPNTAAIRTNIACVRQVKLIKVLSIVAFVLILSTLTIILGTPQANGYEVSIYGAFPWYFWVALILSIVFGQLSLVVYVSSNLQNRAWVLGLFPILAANSILLLLPFFRGYVLYGRGDLLTHVGYAKNILNTGFFGLDRYPGLHILTVATTFFSGIDVFKVAYLIPFFFSFLFIASFYLLATQLLTKRQTIIIVPLFAVLLFSTLNVLFAPFPESFLALPFFLYLLVKSWQSNRRLEFTALVFVTLFFNVVFHPFTVWVIIGILLVIGALSRARRKSSPLGAPVKTGGVAYLLLVTLVCFFGWQFYLILFENTLQNLSGALFGTENIASTLTQYSGLASNARLSLGELLQYTILSYGQFLLLAVLSIFAVFFLYRSARKNRDKLSFSYWFSAACFLSFIALTLLSAVAPLVVTYDKVLVVAIVFSLVLISLFAYQIFFDEKSAHKLFAGTVKKRAVFCLILIPIVCLSVSNLYYSPSIKQINQQAARSELTGMQTYFENRDQKIQALQIGITDFRFFDVLYSVNNRDFFGVNLGEGPPPDHFGYDKNASLSTSTQTPTYLLVTDAGRNFYPWTLPNNKESWRFTPDDFSRLNQDPGLQAIYNNGNLNVYLTKPT